MRNNNYSTGFFKLPVIPLCVGMLEAFFLSRLMSSLLFMVNLYTFKSRKIRTSLINIAGVNRLS